jgi:hypothetical protein
MKCQFHDLFQDAFGDLEYSIKERIWHNVKKIPIIGSAGIFLLKTLRAEKKPSESKKLKVRSFGRNDVKHQEILHLKKGDLVKVRSSEEIIKTLDENNKFERCEFMETMWQYCGKRYRVFKRVEKILDPWTNKLRKCKNLVILEGLLCHGDPKHATACDRTCLYYWSEAWLEKVSD